MPFIVKSKDDTINRSFKMRGNNAVEIVASVKPSEYSAAPFEWRYTMNFADCTPEQIMLQAARNLHVRFQDKFRKAATAEGADPMDVIKSKDWDIMWVKKFLEAERQTATPLQRAKAAVGKMSDAEKAELLKMLQD